MPHRTTPRHATLLGCALLLAGCTHTPDTTPTDPTTHSTSPTATSTPHTTAHPMPTTNTPATPPADTPTTAPADTPQDSTELHPPQPGGHATGEHLREPATEPLPDDGLGDPATGFIIHPSDDTNPQPTIDAAREASTTTGITLEDIYVNSLGSVVVRANTTLTPEQTRAFIDAITASDIAEDVEVDGLMTTQQN
ncbi:hypothetical protein [Corynebacterium aquilae]|nr:hypothetical protein [Corynebacterium aquilae]